MILSDLSKMRRYYAALFFFPIFRSSSGVNDINVTMDLVNNTHSWSRLTRRWIRNSSRCCTSTDWICSNLSFRTETPDTCRNCPILRSKSQRNRCRCPIYRPRQNYNENHNIILLILLLLPTHFYRSDAPPGVII